MISLHLDGGGTFGGTRERGGGHWEEVGYTGRWFTGERFPIMRKAVRVESNRNPSLFW